MKIILVGASGTMGRALIASFGKEHEVVTVGSKSGDILADIRLPDAIERMYREAGTFDALVSTAGPSFVGPWKKMGPEEFGKGLEGKLMGQVNLVLIGQQYIKAKGSFTLISGALTDEPQLHFANASACNGAIDAFVRAAAIELDRGIRINAVSPTVIEDSPQYFDYFPGDVPVKMEHLVQGFRRSLFGAGTGQVIKVR